MGEGDRREVKINGGEAVEDFFNKQLRGGGSVGILKNLLISVMNEKRDINV